MIVRGTTQEQIFILPFYLERISQLYVTYFQDGEKILEKSLADGKFSTTENGFLVNLSQEDTLLFKPSKLTQPVKSSLVIIQLRVKLDDNRALASDIIKERVYDVLKDGVI